MPVNALQNAKKATSKAHQRTHFHRRNPPPKKKARPFSQVLVVALSHGRACHVPLPDQMIHVIFSELVHRYRTQGIALLIIRMCNSAPPMILRRRDGYLLVVLLAVTVVGADKTSVARRVLLLLGRVPALRRGGGEAATAVGVLRGV